MTARDLTGNAQPGQLGTVGNPLDYPPAPVGVSTTTGADTVDTTLDGAITAASPADGGSFDVDDATGFPDPPSSTLDGAIDALSTSSITLDDASGFDDAGEVKVDDERIAYGSKSGNVLSELDRGVGGTTAAAHDDGATVRQPRVVVIERERVAYHTLASDTLGDVRRPKPVDHANGAAVGPNGLSLTLASVAGFSASGGLFRVGDEAMTYAGVSGSTVTGVGRAASGTSVESHASSAAVDLDAYPAPNSTRSARGRPRLRLPNRSGGSLGLGTFVKTATGGGFEAAGEGDPILGLLAEDVVDDAWGAVIVGGYVSALLDAGDPDLPGECEPVFLASASTLKSLANAGPGDHAVGYCLRTHAVDYDGSTALATARVDLLMVSELGAPFEAP